MLVSWGLGGRLHPQVRLRAVPRPLQSYNLLHHPGAPSHVLLPYCSEQLSRPYVRLHVGVRSRRPCMAGSCRERQWKEHSGCAEKVLRRQEGEGSVWKQGIYRQAGEEQD
jgi:hypothetical protein